MNYAPRAGGLTTYEVSIEKVLRNAGAVVTEVFDGMSSLQRFRRFGVGMPRLPEHLLLHLSSLDDDGHVAYAAWNSGHAVGLGRYIKLDPATAELAVSVVDGWTRRGIGTRLLEQVIRHAAKRGVRHVQAVISPDNAPALAIARRMSATVSCHAEAYLARLKI